MLKSLQTMLTLQLLEMGSMSTRLSKESTRNTMDVGN